MGAGASVSVNTSSQKETEKMKTRTMKSVRGKIAACVSAVAVGMLTHQAFAANYFYQQDAEDACCWDGKVWYWGNNKLTSLSYTEFGSHDLSVNRSTEEYPLRITNGIAAVASTLSIGTSFVSGYSPVVRVESGGSLSTTILNIGGASSRGRLLIEGGDVTISGTNYVGGVTSDGFSEIVLSNGTLRLTKASDMATTAANLYLGKDEGRYGILRGWGSVVKGSKVARMMLGDGMIVGDGFGEQRELDLHTLASICSVWDTESAVPADTTNGWYAVNKGAVLFPRTWFNASSYNGRVGAFGNTDASTNFVNSVQFVVGGTNGKCRFQGGVFAEDRDDVHADALPSNKGVVGIWKLGLFTDSDTPSVRNFTSCQLTFRYDQTKTKPGDKLALLRWEESKWVKVAETVVPEEGEYRISMGSRSCLTSETYNAGTFALVRIMPKGFIISFY